ncbi:MAG: TIGR01440 family protein [Streptococcaceae bacterium]|jgi:uncharacterized protein (TIGR01440 family)|nr:TIGR01440 family protein [Streptococcaceae bacterium]
MDLVKLAQNMRELTTEVVVKSLVKSGDIFVLGLSTSEVNGGVIGHNSNQEVGEVIVSAALDVLRPRGIYLAVQGCEHLNRALAVEKELAEKRDLEVVSVLPSVHAGGSGQLAAFKFFTDPVEVEHITALCGLDIGDTAIGMHIKHVQIPLRLKQKELGFAHVSALASRPKLIGGARAGYPKDEIRKY